MDEPEKQDHFDRLDENLDKLSKIVSYQDANRMELLLCHSIIALFVGLWWAIPEKYSFVFMGSSVDFGPPVSLEVIPYIDIEFYTSVSFVGGVFLFSGLFMGRNIPIELAGMGIIMVWDVVMAFTFLISGSYAVMVYGMLGRMMWIHMKTAWRMLNIIGP